MEPEFVTTSVSITTKELQFREDVGTTWRFIIRKGIKAICDECALDSDKYLKIGGDEHVRVQ